jgi:hypothetical protein
MTLASQLAAGLAVLVLACSAAAQDELPTISSEATGVSRAAAVVHLEELNPSYAKGKEIERHLRRVREYAAELSRVPEGPRPLADTFRTYVQMHGLYDNLEGLVRLLDEHAVAAITDTGKPARLSSDLATQWSEALMKHSEVVFKLEGALFDLIDLELRGIDKERARHLKRDAPK